MGRSSFFAALFLLAPALPVLGACTATRDGFDACETNAECRDAFGLGSVCGEDGFCQQADPFPRCARTFPSDLLTNPERARGRFVIGAIADETLMAHRARQNSVQLAARQVEDQRGLPESMDDRDGGREVGVVFCTNAVDDAFDELGRDAASAAITRYLARELGLHAIVGPPSSGSTRAAFEVVQMEMLDTLIISPSATSPALTALEAPATDTQPGLLWRTAPPDVAQGRALARDMFEQGARNVAIVRQDSDYGFGLETEVRQALEDLGVLSMTFGFEPDNDTSRDGAVGMAAGEAFDAVLFISSQTGDVADFLQFAEVQERLRTRPLWLTDSARNQDLLDLAASASELFANVRGTFPSAAENDVFTTFVGSYRAEFGGMDPTEQSFTAQAFDAAWLVFLGAARAVLVGEPLGGRALARGIRALSGSAPMEAKVTLGANTLDRAVNGLRTNGVIDVLGASGELNYDPAREELLTSSFEIWAIVSEDGRFVFARQRVIDL